MHTDAQDPDAQGGGAQDQAEQPGPLHRATEQGDDLTEQHSVSKRHDRAERPYAPPRQPAQDPPRA